MKLPDFLIIGAMKAGTTTLYRDLMTHPRVFFPIDKEPGNLTDDAVLGGEGLAGYAALFAGAAPGQIAGEASTAYTKRPTHEGVAARARTLLGPDLRVIYLMREPVSRVISQHRHELTSGEIGERSLDEAVARHPRLLDYSRYAMQLEPWLDALGRGRVLALEMEAFTADRAGTVARVQRFLGLEPMPERVEADRVYNRSDEKPVMRGRWRGVQQSWAYQRLVRPVLGVGIRQWLRVALLPTAQDQTEPVSASMLEAVRGALAADTARLGELLGQEAPSWARGPAG
jgi:hypothetical protein